MKELYQFFYLFGMWSVFDAYKELTAGRLYEGHQKLSDQHNNK
jgi:hypothetical protein